MAPAVGQVCERGDEITGVRPVLARPLDPPRRGLWWRRLVAVGLAGRCAALFATGGCGAMSAKRHPARPAWLAIRTKALSPRASQKDRLVRSSSSDPAWPAMAQPRAARPSAVARSSSSGARKTAIAAPEPAAVWVAPSVMTMPPLPSPAGRRCRGQCVPVNMAPHSAHRPGRQSLPAASTTSRRTSAIRRRRRTGTALARQARTRAGADPGGRHVGKDSHAGHCRPAARWQAIG